MTLDIKYWVLLLIAIGLILPFQNCSNGFKTFDSNNNFAYSEEFCASETTSIDNLQEFGVNAQRVEFCNFRKLTTPVSNIKFGYVEQSVLDEDRLILKTQTGLFLFDVRNDSYQEITDFKDRSLLNFLLFPSLNKIALIMATPDKEANKPDSYIRKLYVYDLATMQTVFTSKKLSNENYINCSYVARLENFGKVICSYPGDSDPKKIQPGIVDVKNLKEIKLADIGDSYTFSNTWPTYQLLQSSYYGFFTLDNLDQIIVKVRDTSTNADVQLLLNETDVQVIDPNLTYDFYLNEVQKNFNQFTTDYNVNFTYESDETTVCNGVDYATKMSYYYFSTNFNITRSRIICDGGTALFYDSRIKMQECTTLDNCHPIAMTELGVPITMDGNSFFSKKKKSIYSMAAFEGNFYFHFWEKYSLTDKSSQSIKLPNVTPGYLSNWIFKGGSSWYSEEIRLVGDKPVMGMDIFDDESNHFLRLPPILDSLNSNFIFRQRRVIDGKRFFIAGAMSQEDKLLIVSSDREVTELEGRWIPQADEMDDSKNEPVIFFADKNATLKSYHLKTKIQTTVYQLPQSESLINYAQMNQYVAFVSYSTSGDNSRFYRIYDLEKNELVLNEPFGQNGTSLLAARAIKGFIFFGTEPTVGSAAPDNYIYHFNVETKVINKKKSVCAATDSNCTFYLATNNGSAYLASSGGVIYNLNLEVLTETPKGYRFYSLRIEKPMEYFYKYDNVTKKNNIVGFNYATKSIETVDTSKDGYYNVQEGVLVRNFSVESNDGTHSEIELIKAGKPAISISNHRYLQQEENQLLSIAGLGNSRKVALIDINSWSKRKEWTTTAPLDVRFVNKSLLQWTYQVGNQNLVFIEKL